MESMEFYDVHDQSKYRITVSRPENVDELSDLFITSDELNEIVGRDVFFYGQNKRTFKLNEVIEAEVRKWAEKLEASGKKTLLIEDEELLDVLKEGYLSEFTPDTDRYGRHGNRICFARRYKRVKTKAVQKDVNNLWSYLQSGFRDKYGCWPSHIPRYDRSLNYFKAFKDIVGWRRVRKLMCKEYVKFYRQIWDHPEEFM